jgi:hypothetical protein
MSSLRPASSLWHLFTMHKANVIKALILLMVTALIVVIRVRAPTMYRSGRGIPRGGQPGATAIAPTKGEAA